MVHFLWIEGERKYISRQMIGKFGKGALCTSLRHPLRLFTCSQRVESTLLPATFFQKKTVAGTVHRFEESIGGRAYLIEVASVAADRWRAYIVRVPGVPTALMPFYGRTPDEAAHLLSEWLTRAHARAAAPST